MIAEIARTLGSIELDEEGLRQTNKHICVVEAGTGTGKTIAYLIAALTVAKSLNKKVVLSTATIALQEQVVNKDLPELMRACELDLQFVLAKGRGRYLCLSKLDRLLHQDSGGQLIPFYEDDNGVIDQSDMRLYETMMSHLTEGTWDGDKDNWEAEFDTQTWQRVITDHRQCTGRKCAYIRQCAFFKARDALDNADCVVANHDLVLADLALGGGAILPAPEQSIYIFDEGHHLPDKAVNHFSCHFRFRSAIRWLGQAESQWPDHLATLSEASYLQKLAEPLGDYFAQARAQLESTLPLVEVLAEDADFSDKTPRKRFIKGEVPPELEQAAKAIHEAWQDVVVLLEKVERELASLSERESPLAPAVDIETVHAAAASWLGRSEAALALWQNYISTRFDLNSPTARWITVIQVAEPYDYELVASPVLAAVPLQQDLWRRCCGAVVTSATITALGSFDRFKLRAGTDEHCHYAVVPSPFDYFSNALLLVPSDAVEANESERHSHYLIDTLPKIVDAQAGTLVLFASRKQMEQVYAALPASLRQRILIQGAESKQRLIANHRSRIDSSEGSVLFGLASFAEGIDLPGRYCDHVIIAKIPFAVPTDPLESALTEWIEQRGGNAFMEITVPDAAIRLVQASGRLLRTETDTGKITILDKRLLTKRYGKAILAALPPFKLDFS